MTALKKAAENAVMYLRTGFIECPRCGEEVPTANTDAEDALNGALLQEASAYAPLDLLERINVASQDAPSVDEQPTTGDFMTKHHWRNGIHFERLEDGSVKVTGNGPEFTIPANEWPSIVASVSHDSTRYSEAAKFHG